MFGYGFEIGEGFFILFAVIVIGIIIATVIQGIRTWNKNNHSPRLTVDAVVVAKREDVSGSSHGMAGDITGAHGTTMSYSTSYYATFQFESGDRLELSVNGDEYGMLAENDRGKLTFQGTRYLGFERQ